jgi:hypothetical protein
VEKLTIKPTLNEPQEFMTAKGRAPAIKLDNKLVHH